MAGPKKSDELVLEPDPVTPPPKTLGQKLLAVMAKVGYIQKRGHNKFHNYHYATEADVSDKVREAFVEEGLVWIPNLVSVKRREIDTKSGKATITTVVMSFTIADVNASALPDRGMCFTYDMAGEGMDAGDKSLAKAITSCTKYSLLKLLLIATGDDPEADEQTDKAVAPEAPMPQAKAGNGAPITDDERTEMTRVEVLEARLKKCGGDFQKFLKTLRKESLWAVVKDPAAYTLALDLLKSKEARKGTEG